MRMKIRTRRSTRIWPPQRVRARGRRTLPFARDGEVDDLDAPIRFAVRAGALRVYAPGAGS